MTPVGERPVASWRAAPAGCQGGGMTLTARPPTIAGPPSAGPGDGRAGTTAGRRGGALRLAGALTVRGLAGTAHVVLDLLWGGLLATVAWVLVVAGVSGLSAFLIGAVVLFGVLVGARGAAVLERARFAAVLGEDVPAPAPVGQGTAWQRAGRVVVDGATWRALAWVLVVPLLGLVWTVVVVGLWSAALVLVTTPLWARLVTGSDVPAVTSALSGTAGATAAVLAGLLLVPAALLAASGCARADTSLARVLLGASAVATLDRRVQTLTLTRQAAVDAADAERRRIERDLHDGAQQRLVALAVTLGMASSALQDDAGASPRARELVATAHGEAKAAVAELRDLARGIHPAVLTDRGLDAALSALAARCPVPVSVDVAPAARGRCSPTVEATAYFVVAEALTNVARHSGATRCRVAVDRLGDRLLLLVEDDGRGGARAAAGGGLAGLGQRVAGVDGALELSSPPGGPTRLSVDLPCAS